ncbi:unnamed protein product [Adineta steineri]|uniref:NAD(P)(+)--arginine ADP-ribosyltransferase n=1 Tax=Adineta steineri TaxID=433720 RepID=A0A814L645_9BILA|nr:unnamed protein product [Adineta steineri]CAF3982492.1 unnamed protein product [Adineta steineri]
MGTGGSACPGDKLMNQKCQQAMRKKYTQSEPSKFYCACRDGNVDYVREHLPHMLIEDVDKLEGIGDTALHVATRNDHKEIVKLLLKADCSTTTLNHDGKMPYEESKTPEMKKIYMRPTSSSYFHDSDPKTTFEVFQRITQEKVQPIDQEQESKLQYITQEQVEEQKRDWIQTFEDDDELKQHSLNEQTAAMWWKVFHWVSHTFSGTLNRRDFRADLFDLDSDRDFDEFLKKNIDDDVAYKRTKEALKVADTAKDIVPLITLYTSEYGENKKAFYQMLNQQLALASENDIDTSHFCKRFVYEFEMKSDQLENRSFIGTTFRGASMYHSDIKIYEKLAIKGQNGVIALKTFTSTSRQRSEAMEFAIKKPGMQRVLYTYNIHNRTHGIVSVKDVSKYPHEDEVLIIPGNLFMIYDVLKIEGSDLTEIHLEHINTKVSTFKKLRHTITSMRKRPKMLRD